MSKHAYLSASSSHRWLSCPPSARLCAETPDQASPYAKEGTDAHTLCEYKVLTALGKKLQVIHKFHHIVHAVRIQFQT